MTSSLLDSEIFEGRIYCRIERNATTFVNGIEFDLNLSDFYVMIVSGDSVSDKSVNYHTIRSISNEKIKFHELKENSGENFASFEEENSKSDKNVLENSENEIYAGCNEIKICFGIPSGCVKNKNCKSFTSIQKSQGFKHIFEMRSRSGASYIATGISEDEKMGNDFVIECVKFNDSILTFTSITTEDKEVTMRKNEV